MLFDILNGKTLFLYNDKKSSLHFERDCEALLFSSPIFNTKIESNPYADLQAEINLLK